MSILHLIHHNEEKSIRFDGTPVLADVLAEKINMITKLCGGNGKCVIVVHGGVSEPNELEKQGGIRLSCQVRLLGDCEAVLSEKQKMQQVKLSQAHKQSVSASMHGKIILSVDIGTTTLAMRLIDLAAGEELAEVETVNPQVSVAADVMGRINEAMRGGGDRLRTMLHEKIEQMPEQLCFEARKEPRNAESMVVTGNTTMLYMLNGYNTESLSHAPFYAEFHFGNRTRLIDRNVAFPRCLNAFVELISHAPCLLRSFGRRIRSHYCAILEQTEKWRYGRIKRYT